jgi:hypothetical protein
VENDNISLAELTIFLISATGAKRARDGRRRSVRLKPGLGSYSQDLAYYAYCIAAREFQRGDVPVAFAD